MSVSTMATGNLEITTPEWLWLLPLLAAITLLLRYVAMPDKQSGLLPFSSHDITSVIHPLVSLLPEKLLNTDKGRRLNTLFTWLTLTLLIVALTQPVRIGEQIPEPEHQRDIVFIVDTSVSMILRDYVLDGKRIDRSGMLKTVIDRFVANLEGNRISVIVFGETAHTFIPLTLDQQFIRRMLARIEPTMAGRYKAVGDAIALAVSNTRQSPGKHPVFVLFTDVHTPSGKITPQSATQLATADGIPVYTVAIGAASYAAEEQRTSGLLYDPVNLPLLESISASTGARSYQASDADALREAIGNIDRREKNITTTTPRYFRQPLYQWPLLSGLMLIILYQFGVLIARRRG